MFRTYDWGLGLDRADGAGSFELYLDELGRTVLQPSEELVIDVGLGSRFFLEQNEEVWPPPADPLLGIAFDSSASASLDYHIATELFSLSKPLGVERLLLNDPDDDEETILQGKGGYGPTGSPLSFTFSGHASPTGSESYGDGTLFYPQRYLVKPYDTAPDGTRVYSPTLITCDVIGDGVQYFRADLTWSAVTDAEGYVLVRTQENGFDDYRYIDLGDVTAYNDDGSLTGWTIGTPTLTPTSPYTYYASDYLSLIHLYNEGGADFAIDKAGCATFTDGTDEVSILTPFTGDYAGISIDTVDGLRAGANINGLYIDYGGWLYAKDKVFLGSDGLIDTQLKLYSDTAGRYFQIGNYGNYCEFLAPNSMNFLFQSGYHTWNGSYGVPFTFRLMRSANFGDSTFTSTANSQLQDYYIHAQGGFGAGTSKADRKIEINTGAAADGMRISYDTATGGASIFMDILLDSSGNGTIYPTGGFVDIIGTLQTDGYNAADGSAGVSGSFTDGGGNTVTVKDGLVTDLGV